MTPIRFLAIKALVLGAAVVSTNAAHAQTGTRVYIPTGENAEVLIINSKTNDLIDRISGLPAAHGLAVTPDGSRLIVGSFDESAAGEAVPEKPTGVSAADHAAHHAPKPSAAMAPSVSTVSIVDIATKSILRRIDVPGAVHHVAVSPDGRVAAVTQPGADAVTLIDLKVLRVIATLPTGTMPNYAVFSLDGGTLYVSNSAEDTIAVIDRATWSVTDQIATGGSPEHLVLSPDGAWLYVSNVADGSVSVIDLAQAQVVETLPFDADLHGIDISDDGGTLFVAVRGDDNVVSVSLKDGVRRSVPLSPGPYHLNVIRGAGVLYVSSSVEPVVWVIDTTTIEVRAEIEISGIGHQFAQALGN